MRSILSILGIILAGGIFFIYTKPTYDAIQATQIQIAQYNGALDKATKLQQLKQTLLSRYNSFSPNDLTRLQTLLPDQVNNIGLILDLDTLANQFGLSLENVNIGSSDSSSSGVGASAPATGVTTLGSQSQQYDSLDVGFTVHGTYSQFIQYITSLETSLRIVDLVGLTVAGGGASTSGTNSPASLTGNVASSTDNIVYTYGVVLRTYWLK